ncbi:hypothetical protein PC112_g23795, partial [Phytophthora cactorum]
MFETILPGSRVTSTTVQLAFSLTRQDSSARKRIKLLMKFGDLALETLLLYQMLEAGVLPDELRRCKSLRHLSLEYTHTQTFPAWVKEFTKLEYLHVESKFTSPMVVFPDD